ncbi:hypothetical protein MUBE_11510 [Mycobacterium uberis]|uniref:Uncharacterized protein n=1 Tax=Mycobacterium uberis TaxID=2162698 RepID=A0A3E1HEW7_9MYCO|nr:hypothetical protein MUBE_11510 [Mycobacterium uberis]
MMKVRKSLWGKYFSCPDQLIFGDDPVADAVFSGIYRSFLYRKSAKNFCVWKPLVQSLMTGAFTAWYITTVALLWSWILLG